MNNMRFVSLRGGLQIHGFSFAITAILLFGCTPPTIYHTNARTIAPRIPCILNIALSWPSPENVDAIKGAVLIRDGGAVNAPELAIARAILRTNPRIVPAYALVFAGVTTRAANDNALLPEFLAATLLQESAYDPQALSAAGAIGIAQFMPDTAQDVGVNPYDPIASIQAAGSLIGSYVQQYNDRYDDPYGAALAAYNAGPGAVEQYGGVPPYPETRDYIALIFDRWARIVSYERASRARRPGGGK